MQLHNPAKMTSRSQVSTVSGLELCAKYRVLGWYGNSVIFTYTSCPFDFYKSFHVYD